MLSHHEIPDILFAKLAYLQLLQTPGAGMVRLKAQKALSALRDLIAEVEQSPIEEVQNQMEGLAGALLFTNSFKHDLGTVRPDQAYRDSVRAETAKPASHLRGEQVKKLCEKHGEILFGKGWKERRETEYQKELDSTESLGRDGFEENKD